MTYSMKRLDSGPRWLRITNLDLSNKLQEYILVETLGGPWSQKQYTSDNEEGG